MNFVNTLAVPASVAAILSYVFQYLKPLLEAGVPGFRPTDASHDGALRILYGALVFLVVGGYQLYTIGTPTTLDGWFVLAQTLVATAVTFAVAAHVSYRAMVAGSGTALTPAPAPTASADPSFPPGIAPDALQSQLAPAA